MEKNEFFLLGSYGASVALLAAAVFFTKKVNGANGWIFGIQPAEFVKITCYSRLSLFFAKRQETNTPVSKGSGPVLIGVGHNHVFNIKAK